MIARRAYLGRDRKVWQILREESVLEQKYKMESCLCDGKRGKSGMSKGLREEEDRGVSKGKLEKIRKMREIILMIEETNKKRSIERDTENTCM